MAASLISLINRAFASLAEPTLQASEINNADSLQGATALSAVNEVLLRMYSLKGDIKLKSLFSFSTVIGQGLYSPTVIKGLENLGSEDWQARDTNDDVYLIRQIDSVFARDYYTKLSSELAVPGEWWVDVGPTANTLQIRLYPTPDKVYTITGYTYEPYTYITDVALFTTLFTELGDMAVQVAVEAAVANRLEMADRADRIIKAEALFQQWAGEDLRVESTYKQGYQGLSAVHDYGLARGETRL
jgi:hypothetical protein